jgi:hypothetical protein
MNEKEKLEDELIEVYESLLDDLRLKLRNKMIVLSEIVELNEGVEKLEERIAELNFNDIDV